MFAEATLAGRRAALLRRVHNEPAASEALAHLMAQAPNLMADLQPYLADGWAQEGPIAAVAGSWPMVRRLCTLNPAIEAPAARLDGLIALAEVQHPSISAGTRHFQDGSVLIQFDTGLLFATFEFAQLLAAASSVTSPESPADERIARIAALTELQLAQHMVTAGATHNLGLLQDPVLGALSGELTQAAQLFVLAHEFAHVLLGHAERAAATDPQDQHTADVLALNILSLDLADADATHVGAKWLGRLLGVRLLLCCLEVVENHSYVLTGKTHPPVHARWEVLREFAGRYVTKRLLAQVDGLWLPWQQCFDLAVEARLDPAVLEQQYQALDGSWLSRPPPETGYLLDLVDARRSLLGSPLVLDGPDGEGRQASAVATAVAEELRTQPADRALTWRTVLHRVTHQLRAAGIETSTADRFAIAATVAHLLRRG